MAKLKPTHTVHGINFIRTGECNRCGQCCVIEQCPHYKPGGTTGEEKYQGFCEIYDRLDKVCDYCSKNFHGGKKITHEGCIDFPNHPWLKVIKDGICNYQFTRLDEKGNVSNEPLPFMDLDKNKYKK